MRYTGTAEIVKDMYPWFEARGEADSTKSRTAYQKTWDSAILAAAEFVRRRTGDEFLAGEIHILLTPTRGG